MRVRRKARIAVLQALYEADIAHHRAGEALERRLQERELGAPGEQFARDLLLCVLVHRSQLNTMIARYAPDWPLEQMAVIDRNVLRIALCELCKSEAEVPAKVVINEAVELAKLFGSDSSPRFVNGVLGAVMAEPSLPVLDEGLPFEDGDLLTPKTEALPGSGEAVMP